MTPELTELLKHVDVQFAIAPFVAPVAMGLGSFLGGLFGKKNKQQSSSTSNNSFSNTSTPTWGAEYGPLQNTLIGMSMKSLQSPYQLPREYEEAGIRDINHTYDLAEQNLGNTLTARGLGQSGIAGAAEGRLGGGRASDIVKFQGTLPLIQRQMQQEDMDRATGILGMGRGQTSTGTGTSTGTSTSTGSEGGGLGGGLGSLSQMLMYLYGMGKLGGGGGAVNGPMLGPSQWGEGGPVGTSW